MEKIRIDKYLSVACGISRNDAKSLLKQGVVAANGIFVRKAEEKVSEADKITVNGQKIAYKKYIYLVMNKPSGYLSASKDNRAQTVIELVPEMYRHYNLFTVGRLDKDTTGLLLITNDGDFAHKIISPKSNIDKLYRVRLDGKVTEEHIKMFREGIKLVDGTLCLPAALNPLDDGYSANVIIKEGKYHQIKRMFGVVGLGVNSLERLAIGDFFLPEELALGDCRELTAEEHCKLIWSL